jgi:hypothetical protein
MYLMWREMTDFRTSSEMPFLRILLEANMVEGIATMTKSVNAIRMVISSDILDRGSSSSSYWYVLNLYVAMVHVSTANSMELIM